MYSLETGFQSHKNGGWGRPPPTKKINNELKPLTRQNKNSFKKKKSPTTQNILKPKCRSFHFKASFRKGKKEFSGGEGEGTGLGQLTKTPEFLLKNKAANARGLEIGVINHHSLRSSSESNLMTRRAARVREATHALPHAWDASDRAT